MGVILPGETDLYALTDSRLSLGRPVLTVAAQLLKAGIKILQYREKKLPKKKTLEECLLLRKLCTEYDACFIVNDHVDLALLANADGLHIGQDDLPPKDARKLLRRNMCLGLSTHSPEQALLAQAAGVDYIGVGPIFATQTKEDVTAPVGFEYLDWAAANCNLPFVAIGGIKEHNIGDVAAHGASCCALVSEFTSAHDICDKVAKTRLAMQLGRMQAKNPA